MTKIVLNYRYGGFGLSNEAENWLTSHGVEDIYTFYPHKNRTNPLLVKCVEELGAAADGSYAHLSIEEFDEEFYDYTISEYDGVESLNLIPKIRRSQLAKFMETGDFNSLMNYLKKMGVNVCYD